MSTVAEQVLLTEKTGKVLEILKANGGLMTGAEIAAQDEASFEKGARSVTPILTNLNRKGWIDKSDEKSSRTAIDAKTGNEVVRQYTMYQVSDAGKELVYEVK